MDKGNNSRLVAGVIYFAALAILFARPLLHLAIYAMGSELNSHVLLVPFVCAYLIYLRKSNLPRSARPDVGPGLALVFAGLGVWFAVMPFHRFGRALSANDQLSLLTFSFLLWVWGGGFFFLGREWMRATAFPMFFLLFTVPLPDNAVDSLESASKLASADAVDMFFGLSGTPALRDGNVFQLPGITIEVAQECSGIRSSYVLFLTSLLAGNLFLTRTWSRILLVCFVIPLGILRNGFRVWVISMLCIHIGPQMIHSVIHRRGGPFFFALSLIPLFLLLWWLRSREKKRGNARKTVTVALPALAVAPTVRPSGTDRTETV